MTGDTGGIRAQACRLVDGAAPVIPPAPEDDPLALAWALKDLCYEAWHSEPERASRAAGALRQLSQAGVPPAVAGEVQALADWTAGIARVTRGQLAESVALFDRAAAGLRAVGRADPAAQTQVPKIMALSMLGDLGAAARCAETTHAELLALGNVRAAARVSLNLGNLHMTQDAYAEAALHFRQAAVLFARQGEHVQSVLADIGWAVTLSWQGDFDEALRVYARARMRAESRGLTRQLALVEESVALLDLARGRYREALAGFEAARRRYQALGVPQTLAVAEKQLADAYLELRLLPEALALFETAVDRFRALRLPLEEARALTQLGRTQALLGLAPAADAFAAAAALFDAQGHTVGQAGVASARAELSLATGDAAGALRWAEAAAAAYRAAAQADGRARAEVLRAEALLAGGAPDAAAAVFQDTLATARERQQLQVQVRCLSGQGLAAMAAGQQAAALQDFEAAIQLFEEQRSALPGDDMRSAFLADHLRPYQARLQIALSGGDAQDVLLQLDRFRARALDERLAEEATGGSDENVRALRDRLDWLYRRLHRQQEEAGASAALDQDIRRTERELLEQARRQRLAAPRPGTRGAPEPAFTMSALQAALQDGDALVEYGVQGAELFACVVTPQRVALLRRIADWPQVLEAARAVRFQIETLRQGAAPVRRHLALLTTRAQARLQHLHLLLWAPLEAALQGCGRVLVVPHGVLANVPFAALAAAAAAPDQAPPLALGHQLQLALVPSARAALRGLLRPPVPAQQVLALGESSRLPHAAREAALVAGLFAQGRACVGERATLEALHADAGQADVLHLACHAQFRSDNPRFSALHLADGALTVDGAEALGLRACTVVLSACETGLAETSTGDEMMGLVRAFLVAGAARVVASLWPVDDEVTAGFMAAFYGALVQGMGPAAALGVAQQRTALDHPHPYFWGAFTLQGGW